MKKIILLILFIFLTLPCIAEEVIYLDKKWDKEALKILYEFVLDDIGMSPQNAYNAFGYELSAVRATFYDLNSDGKNEIVGYINVSSSYCEDGADFYILKKNNNKYEDISSIHFLLSNGVQVYDSMTNGFYDIGVLVTKQHKNVKAKYNKQYYEYFFPN